MTDLLFTSMITSQGQLKGYFICVAASLVLGTLTALAYRVGARHSRGFVLTLALLPLMVQTVIMLVNGNIGAGVAVAGAFSLVRFRSAPGSAKEIASVFLAMTVGLACGMGYVGIAAVVALIVMVIYITVAFFSSESISLERRVTVTIPESLDYTEVFDDIFVSYTTKSQLLKVKTTNMGSLFKLTYQIKLRDVKREKEFIDEMRCRNGNLDIVCARTDDGVEGML